MYLHIFFWPKHNLALSTFFFYNLISFKQNKRRNRKSNWLYFGNFRFWNTLVFWNYSIFKLVTLMTEPKIWVLLFSMNYNFLWNGWLSTWDVMNKNNKKKITERFWIKQLDHISVYFRKNFWNHAVILKSNCPILTWYLWFGRLFSRTIKV